MESTWKKLKKTLSSKLSLFSKRSSTATAAAGASGSSTGNNIQPPATTDPPALPRSQTLSFSSRLSRSFSFHYASSKTCAICLRGLRKGQGQALFYAECSHPFHFSCIAESVQHGNRVCPICRCKWKDLPFQAPILANTTDPQANVVGRARVSPYTAPTRLQPEPEHFSDDEPLLSVSTPPASSSHLQTLTIRTFLEYPAYCASDISSSFGVLIRIRAPPINETSNPFRAPIDLVAVLDVSGSMVGNLTLLKQAVQFIIQNLGPSDRLSIVAFSAEARRILPLRRMSSGGREDAVRAINSLFSGGGTNIVLGLKKGVKVLEERRECNPIASIILLSDGHDTHSNDNNNQNRNLDSKMEYLKLLPASICPSNRSCDQNSQLQTFPVHAFGFGLDHDSNAMHALSDTSGGTFSFIESTNILQDAFARCVGGLLSVVARDVKLNIEAISPGVQIGSIPSGRYKCEILEQGHQATINVGSLYAEEEKEFLVNLFIPAVSLTPEETSQATQLVDISCYYKRLTDLDMVHLPRQRAAIQRPRVLSPGDQMASLEVDRQRNRLFVIDGIAEAQKMAEAGNFEGARKLLTEQRSSLLSSASAQAGDGLCNLLEAELIEIERRMATREAYDRTGRAYVLSGLSSHSWQRATTRGQSGPLEFTRNGAGGSSGASATITYQTPSMANMVTKSQILQVNVARDTRQPQRIFKSSSLVDRR